MATANAVVVAIAIEDADDFFTVGDGVLAVEGDLTSSELFAADPGLA